MTANTGLSKPDDENVPTPTNTGMTRRAMLFKLGLLFNGVVAAALAVPIVGYLLAPAVRERRTGYESWLSLGSLEQFPAGQTRLATFRNPVVSSLDGETADIPCWVRNVDGHSFQVFAINCAHLGCPVRWFPQSNLFMCPCHGGAYYQDGSRASGPPERGMFEYSYKVEDGKLFIKAGAMPTPGRAANSAGGKSRCV
jgi:menaquinol-cytochrome c reductase iron-sulfur subunit